MQYIYFKYKLWTRTDKVQFLLICTVNGWETKLRGVRDSFGCLETQMPNLELFRKEPWLFYCFPKDLAVQPCECLRISAFFLLCIGKKGVANIKPEGSNRRGQIKWTWNLVILKSPDYWPRPTCNKQHCKGLSKIWTETNPLQRSAILGDAAGEPGPFQLEKRWWTLQGSPFWLHFCIQIQGRNTGDFWVEGALWNLLQTLH